MCWDGVCSRPPASGFLAVRLSAGPFALPAQATLWGGVPFKEAPVSPLATQVWSTGTTHLCLTALRDRAVLAQRSPDYLDRSSRFPKHLKVQGNPPPRSPSHSPGGEGEATVCLPPRKGRALGMWEHSLQPTLSLQRNPLTCPSEAGSGEGLVLTDGVSLSLSLTCMGSRHPTWRGGFSPFEASAETSKSQEKSPLTSSFMPFL